MALSSATLRLSFFGPAPFSRSLHSVSRFNYLAASALSSTPPPIPVLSSLLYMCPNPSRPVPVLRKVEPPSVLC
ncbi:hypothetical protein GY45DRAFT_1328540 [Cubamyces sp. BRFM 1775]|nr:hypothetical protein GY45DRAFT_1328540 [Cubamyces sp. BRFM 1775]